MPQPQAARPVLRFAPSPNGALHAGHALSALLNADIARRLSGRLLVRIEDIDLTRCTPALEAAALDDLRWLGIAWEEPVRRQSEHFDAYRAALDRLVAVGVAYPSFLSRGEVRALTAEVVAAGRPWPRDPDGVPHHPTGERTMSPAERRRRLESGGAHAWRLDMNAALGMIGRRLSWHEASGDRLETVTPVEAYPARWGDVVLARKDVPTSYHLSVVVDDALQGVTHVVRGEDLREATAVHRVLQDLLGLPQPTYHHHRLVRDADGRKLSKSIGSMSLAAARANGATPEDIRRLVGLSRP